MDLSYQGIHLPRSAPPAPLAASGLASFRRPTAGRSSGPGVLLSLVQAVRLRHLEIGAHLCRISHLVGILAFHRGFTREQIATIRAAAALHDIGKIAIAEVVLDKSGPLDAAEWEIVKQHPMVGAALLPSSPSPASRCVRQVALSHHERWDGSGYPHGLRGEDIPMAARMVMLCDQYDALRSPRSYKPAYDHATTCQILFDGDERTRPGHFDPRLLALFRRIHPRFEAFWDRLLGFEPSGQRRLAGRRLEAGGEIGR